MKGRIVRLAAAVVALAATGSPAASAATAFVPEMQIGDAIPASPLLDQNGRSFSFASLRGDAVLVTFVFTRCREARECPLESAKFARLQERTRGLPIRLVEFTIDPAHDTPAVLSRYAAAFGADPARWTFVTGSPASVAAMLARFGVSATPAGPGNFAHTDLLAVVDTNGLLADRIERGDWSIDEAYASARDAAGLASDPLARAMVALQRGVAAACGSGTSGLNYAEGFTLLLALVILLGGIAIRLLGGGSPLRRR